MAVSPVPVKQGAGSRAVYDHGELCVESIEILRPRFTEQPPLVERVAIREGIFLTRTRGNLEPRTGRGRAEQRNRGF